MKITIKKDDTKKPPVPEGGGVTIAETEEDLRQPAGEAFVTKVYSVNYDALSPEEQYFHLVHEQLHGALFRCGKKFRWHHPSPAWNDYYNGEVMRIIDTLQEHTPEKDKLSPDQMEKLRKTFPSKNPPSTSTR